MAKQLILFPVPVTGHKVSKRKSLSLDRIKVNHTIAKRRYYYRRRLDKQLFKIKGAERIIHTDFQCLEDIPVGKREYGLHNAGQRHYIEELMKLGYYVQYKLPLGGNTPGADPGTTT